MVGNGFEHRFGDAESGKVHRDAEFFHPALHGFKTLLRDFLVGFPFGTDVPYLHGETFEFRKAIRKNKTVVGQGYGG